MRGVIAALAAMAAAQAGAESPAARTDVLDLAAGSVVLSVSSEYGGSWSALRLLDGSTATGWCSESGTPFPHTIVIELPQAYLLSALAVDNTGAQDDGYPGISAKAVTIHASTTSAAAGFAPLAAIEAPAGGRREVKLDAPVKVQWIKVVVSSNWGNEEYTELMELEAYGEPTGAAPKVSAAGIFETTYGLLRIEQDGGSIRACYDWNDGQLAGSIAGRVMQLEWSEAGGERGGAAIMVLSGAGEAINGVWYQGGELQGEWSGTRSSTPPQCTLARTTLASRLAAAGKAVVYGIYFDPASAALKGESETALREVLAALGEKGDLALEVAGHTDSENTEAYNLTLSQRRAEAVVRWLVEHGVAAERLTAKGYGEARPVAANTTAAGRALNRRVELAARR